LLEVNIGETQLDQVVLLSAQLLTEAIFGLDFLINYEAEINEELFNFKFTGAKEPSANRFCDLGLMSIHSQTQQQETADNKGHCYTNNFAMGGEDESVQVREQIQAKLKDGILEESHYAYINPIILIVREGKAVRIYLDARRINKEMVADIMTVMPMREILQKFYGVKYIMSLDLTIVFLQAPLEQFSRQLTAFQCESNVYQFTTVSCGFTNSLTAFIRALEKVLVDSGLNNNSVMYIDDLFIHPSTFTEQLHHTYLVLDKFTSAGFTVNAAKCKFCKHEIKFLGHIISDKVVKADRERIESILRYPVPKNQRQLRKFLGIPNFHQQFILKYSSYVERLLILLRK
jgi:hypothetical protein